MMSFDHWLRLGIELGHCGPAVCDTHDGTPMTEEEAEQRYSRSSATPSYPLKHI